MIHRGSLIINSLVVGLKNEVLMVQSVFMPISRILSSLVGYFKMPSHLGETTITLESE